METGALRKDFWIKTIEASFDQGWFSSLQAVAYDSIHQCVAAGGDSGKVSLLSLQTGATQELPSVGDRIRCLAFGIGSDLFVGAENGSLTRLSVDTGLVELVQKVSDKAITSVAYSVEYGLLVGSDDRRVRLVDPHNLAVRAVSPKEGSYVQSVAFADDGAFAVSAGCDNRLRVYGIPALDAVQVIYQGGDSQREATAGHGVCVSGGKDGLVSIVRDTDPADLSCLPVSSDEIIAVLIPRLRHSLVTADAKGRLLEWSLSDLRPLSALDAECTLKDVALSDSGDTLVLCSDSKVRCFLRASTVDQLKVHIEEKRFQESFLGLLQSFFRWLFRKPDHLDTADPRLPPALARRALNIGQEELAHEQSLSDTFVSCYDAVATSAKQINWKAVAKGIQQYQRDELERQKQELSRMREERLQQAAEEARRRREFREKVYRDRQEAQRQAERLEAQRRAEAQRRSDSFWRGVGRLLTDTSSSPRGDSGNRTRQVRSYVRKDGTRVRSYKRR